MAEVFSIPKPVRERDSDYTTFVKSKPCCLPVSMFVHACGFGPRLDSGQMARIQPHHVSPRNGTKGTGSKVSDRRQVPVCHAGHRYCEAHPLEVLEYLNGVIRDLNREYAALSRRKVVVRGPRFEVGLGIKGCPACHGDHFYDLPNDGKKIKGYWCKQKNVWVELPSRLLGRKQKRSA